MNAFGRTGFAVIASALFAVACSSADERTDVSTSSEAELRKRPDPCATVRCAAGYHCESKGRNASCVEDAPSTSSCAAVLCAPNTTCVETSTGPQCQCTSIALCIQGYAWNSTTCQCEPSAPAAECSSDSDCRAVDNYCGGCSCIALATNETAPTCSNPVMCFAQPCAVTSQSPACVNGACVMQ